MGIYNLWVALIYKWPELMRCVMCKFFVNSQS